MTRLVWVPALALACAAPQPPSEPPPVTPPARTPAEPASADPPALAVEPRAAPPNVAPDLDLLEPRPPRWRTCKTNSAGECIYRAKPLDPEPRAYTQDELDELRDYEAYVELGDDPERVRDARYTRLWMLAAHDDLGGELDAAEAFVHEYDGQPVAAWAALLVLDELARRALERDDRSAGDVEALIAWIERLPTLALWQLDAGFDLRAATPTLLAGALWQRAVMLRERGDYQGCADTFLGIYNRFEDHDRADELLVHASDCLLSDLRVDEAIAVRRQVLERYPDSDFADSSLDELGRLELATARYEDALDDLLRHARGLRSQSWDMVPHTGPVLTYSPDPRRDQALIHAYVIAAALDRREVAEIRELFGQRDRRSQPTRGEAIAHWDMRPSEGRALAAFARAQLELFEQAWPIGALEARVALGQDAWRRACRDRIEQGLCVARQAATPRGGCWLSGEAPPKLRRRRASDVDAARAELRRAVELGPAKPAGDEDEARGRAALALAEFTLLELELESSLADVTDLAIAEALGQRYADVAALGDPIVALHAAARIALIWETLANAGLRRPASGERCVAKDAATEAAVERAKAAYETCLARAIAAQHFDELARRCEAALTTIDPQAFPPLAELVPLPSAAPAPAPAVRGVGVSPEPPVAAAKPLNFSSFASPTR